MAVGLLAGPGAVLSHGTAAAIHGLPGLIAPKVPELTVANPRHPRPPGAVVHRVDHIDPCDIEIRRGLQVTTPERTVIDLASQLDGPLLARILDEGSIAGLWTSEDVMACAERVGTKGRRGSVTLRTLLAERGHEPQADNMLELRMIRVLAPYAPFETQFHLVLDGELLILDIAWPQWRVGAEVDGWWVRNQSRTKFDRTFSRANLLIAHHWRIAHLTSTMDDLTVLRDVGRLLPPHVFEQAMSRRAGGRRPNGQTSRPSRTRPPRSVRHDANFGVETDRHTSERPVHERGLSVRGLTEVRSAHAAGQAVRWSGCPAVGPSGRPLVRLSGCPAVRLPGCPALGRANVWPYGCRPSSCRANVRPGGCAAVRPSRASAGRPGPTSPVPLAPLAQPAHKGQSRLPAPGAHRGLPTGGLRARPGTRRNPR